MMNKVWFDSKLVKWNNAKVHIMTHGLHYGTGIFEGLRCYKTKSAKAIFRLDDHLKRFFKSAEALSMRLPYSFGALKKAVITIAKLHKEKNLYIRPLAFYGCGKIGPDPRDAKINVCIFAVPLKHYLAKEAVSVKISPFKRIPYFSYAPGTKICGAYFNAALSSKWAHRKGADEALMLDHKGNIAEGAAENLFFIKNGKIFTPKSTDILNGITRDTLIKVLPDIGFRVIERITKPRELLNADEVFFCGTGVEIHAIGRVENRKTGNGGIGPITQRIKDFYSEITHGEIQKYKKWLTLT